VYRTCSNRVRGTTRCRGPRERRVHARAPGDPISELRWHSCLALPHRAERGHRPRRRSRVSRSRSKDALAPRVLTRSSSRTRPSPRYPTGGRARALAKLTPLQQEGHRPALRRGLQHPRDRETSSASARGPVRGSSSARSRRCARSSHRRRLWHDRGRSRASRAAVAARAVSARNCADRLMSEAVVALARAEPLLLPRAASSGSRRRGDPRSRCRRRNQRPPHRAFGRCALRREAAAKSAPSRSHSTTSREPASLELTESPARGACRDRQRRPSSAPTATQEYADAVNNFANAPTDCARPTARTSATPHRLCRGARAKHKAFLDAVKISSLPTRGPTFQRSTTTSRNARPPSNPGAWCGEGGTGGRPSNAPQSRRQEVRARARLARAGA